MRAAFSLVPPYLQTDGKLEGVNGLPWFSEYGFQQTRGFRALKVWMALRHHRLSGYRASIERDISLARTLADAASRAPDFDLLEPQELSIVCFRYRPQRGNADRDAISAINKRILEAVQLGGRVFLTGTTTDGLFWLRACIVNPRATLEDVEAILDIVRDAAREQA